MSNHLAERPTTTDRVAKWIRRLCVPIVLFWVAVAALSNVLVPQLEAVGKQVRLQGWVRTRRDSKGGFSFIELNDGSCQGNVQIVAPGELTNYEAVVKQLHTGASVSIDAAAASAAATTNTVHLEASATMIAESPGPITYPSASEIA